MKTKSILTTIFLFLAFTIQAKLPEHPCLLLTQKGIEKIKINPWLKITIPKSDSTIQRAISAEACREFFNRPLPETKMISSLPELGRDVALLSLCLGGINTVDNTSVNFYRSIG